jgi:cell division protein FtsB
MTNEKKQAVKNDFKKVGKAVWSAIPWVLMWLGLVCWFLLPHLYANEEAELKSQISALEAENAMYELQNARLDDEINWLRSLIEQEDGDGQIQP